MLYIVFGNYILLNSKRKESLETLAERAVLRAYVENHSILEHILLYRASKYKQTKNTGLLRLLVNSHFSFVCD